jgi:hypothetical protein
MAAEKRLYKYGRKNYSIEDLKTIMLKDTLINNRIKWHGHI